MHGEAKALWSAGWLCCVTARTPWPATSARARARREHLLALQDAGGWWKGELQTNVTMDAEDMLLREFLGIRERDDDRVGRLDPLAAARGRLVGELPRRPRRALDDDRGLRRAAPRRRRSRGAAHAQRRRRSLRERRRISARASSRTSGWRCSARGPGSGVPELPPELMLLPPWAPINIYDFACWARQTVVAMSIVARDAPDAPAAVHARRAARRGALAAPRGARPARALAVADRVLAPLSAAGRCAPCARRRSRAPSAGSCAARRPTARGAGIQPPWVYSLIALHLRGYPIEHPVIRAGLDGLERFTIHESSHQRLEACQSPVWDTALAIVALADAGAPPMIRRSLARRRWLLDEQVLVPATGRSAARRCGRAAGRSSSPTTTTPTSTTRPRSCSRCCASPIPTPSASRDAIARAVELGRGHAGRERGGWGAFDAANTKRMLRDVPFCDFGEVIDPPSADVTAHALEMLAAVGRADTRAGATGRSPG